MASSSAARSIVFSQRRLGRGLTSSALASPPCSSTRTVAGASPVLSVRSYASSSSAPCSDYLAVTHPDSSADPSSQIGQTLARFDSATLATYARPSVLLTRGKGLDLWAKTDPSQNEGQSERLYLDFSSGIAVNSLGHADDQIAKIAGEQAATLVHSSNLYHNEWSGELASKMVELTRQKGGLGMAKGQEEENSKQQLKVFLANSGTEANEAALKFARKHAMVAFNKAPAEKAGLVSFRNAFHGRTMGALSMTPAPKYQAPFAPLIGDTHLGDFNSFDNINELINEKTAGVILEPVQGEGGIFPAKIEWLKAIRKRCDEVGALLIFDEIQCGLYRSGTLWCHSEMPVEAHPDLITMAKPLANGFPIGAVLMRKKVADAITVGDHGTTFGGGPLASRIAHHVLSRLSEPSFALRVMERSQHLLSRLEELRNHFPDLIAHQPDSGKPSPRGKGLLVGMSMAHAPDAGRVVTLARERGLIVLSAGSDTVRIAPSLTVSPEQIDKAADILESCLLVLRDEKQGSSTA
ncbi:unnamed protein product [Parajaminaea phylloscopi]